MIKKLARFVGQYKKNAILGPLFLLGEVFMDIFQPFVVASLIDKGIQAQNTAAIFRYGALMLGCALMSLFHGFGSSHIVHQLRFDRFHYFFYLFERPGFSSCGFRVNIGIGWIHDQMQALHGRKCDLDGSIPLHDDILVFHAVFHL